MEEKLLQQLDSILLFLEKTAQATIDFSQEQIPDVIHELLAWNFTASLIMFCFWLVLSLCFCIIGILFFRSRVVEDFIDRIGFLSLFWVVGLFTTVCAIASNTWLKILIAPKVWLLEYAARLLHN